MKCMANQKMKNIKKFLLNTEEEKIMTVISMYRKNISKIQLALTKKRKNS